MKTSFIGLVVALTLLVCSCQKQAKPETNFLRDFNMGKIVGKMNVPELKPKMSSGGVGISHGEITERKGGYYLEFNILEEAGERFNEAKFFDALRVEIGKRINESGVRINGSSSGGKSFDYTYSENGNRGSLAVVGTRLEGNRFMLWYFVIEIAGEENVD